MPRLRWLLDLAALLWPTWGLRPRVWTPRLGLCRLHQWLLLTLVGSLVASHLAPSGPAFDWGLGLTLGVLANQSQPLPVASGRILEDGIYELRLCGDFVIRYQPADEFDRRMFLLFLRQIHLVDGPPKRPFLRQEWLASWFGTLQELISRWECYRRDADWRRLMSRHVGAVLSLDEQRPILRFWAVNFWLTPEEVAEHLCAQGIKVTPWAVETVGKESGFSWVRQELLGRFKLEADSLQPRAGWLVGRLFRLVEALLAKVEAGEPLSAEERVEIAAEASLERVLGCPERGLPPASQEPDPDERELPPLYALERLCFGWWEPVEDDSVRCPHCQSSRVARKSRKGRPKRFDDAAGQIWVVEVNRYYCKHKACPHGSFTDLPAGLLPYSRWSESWHFLALHKYAWARETYRLVGRELAIPGATVYRWVREYGQELLPIGALFGLVRSSGVVGIDEKWVKVPKNDKPAGKHRKWMYVHFAVAVYTYDLLHIAIFPYENGESARAFLLELKAFGAQSVWSSKRRAIGQASS